MLGQHHVELNGVRYKVVPSEEGYMDSGEPLRPPNSQILQGQSNLFNIRPDLLKWRIADWSGGQGLYAFSGQLDEANQYWKGRRVDGFTRYGVITPGWEESSDDTNLTEHLFAVVAGSGYAMDVDGVNNYLFSGGAWVSANSTTDNTHDKHAVCGDDDYLYYYDGTTGTVYRDNISNDSASEVVGTGGPTVAFPARCSLFSFRNALLLVVNNTDNSEKGVWQMTSTTGDTTMTKIYDMSGVSVYGNPIRTAALGPNRVYFAVPGNDFRSTEIHEIVPDDSSATGYGFIRARIPGVYPETMWFHMGFLWISGRSDSQLVGQADIRGRQIFYLDLAQQTFGTLNSVVRDTDEIGYGAGGAVDGWLSHLVSYVNDGSNEYFDLFQIDQARGAVQHVGGRENAANATSLGYDTTLDIVWGDNKVAVADGYDGANRYLYWWDKNTPTDNGFFITSWYEFGVSSLKSLASVEGLLRDDMPANWDIKLYYQADDDEGDDISDFTLIGTFSTDGATSFNFDIGDIEFNRLRFLVEFDYTGGGTPSSKPELTLLEANAQLMEKIRVRELTLLLMDEQGPQGRTGKELIDNIQTVGALGTTVDFKDGMGSRQPDEYDQYNVVVDAYRINLVKPGEGFAWVRLLESY